MTLQEARKYIPEHALLIHTHGYSNKPGYSELWQSAGMGYEIANGPWWTDGRTWSLTIT